MMQPESLATAQAAGPRAARRPLAVVALVLLASVTSSCGGGRFHGDPMAGVEAASRQVHVVEPHRYHLPWSGDLPPDLLIELVLFVAPELDRVGALFGVSEPRSIQVHFVPVDRDQEIQEGDPERRVHAQARRIQSTHVRGWAAATGERVVVYIPEVPLHLAAGVLHEHLPVVSHEVSHAMAAQAGVAFTQPWMNEGIACCVADLRPGPLRASTGLTPRGVLAASTVVQEGTVAELLAWDDALEANTADPEVTSRRYRASWVLAWFLLREQGDVPFDEALGRLLEFEPDDVAAREDDLLAWVAALDMVAEVRAHLEDEEPARRDRAWERLRVHGGDPQFAALRDPRVDALLPDEVLRGSTEASLDLWWRAPTLDEDLVASMEASPHAVVRLAALAARSRRGEEVDLAEAEALARALDPAARRRAGVFLTTLGLGELQLPAHQERS